ncbi:glycogenin-1 isoform X1 [Dermacentor silvarum]|uniref:glycogenin-1 isoform X1 n=1 Tax=Dermacentor silvarum TaxID=543639 RepID=UPI0018985A74|nr:glycogenin-1 isoform X1 [Dermacentor silvarum]
MSTLNISTGLTAAAGCSPMRFDSAAYEQESGDTGKVTDEAYVTLATDDTYSLGALVLAHSLKRVHTSRQLVILITSAVTPQMRSLLAQSFDLVEEVNLLDSRDPANLALLNRPELGVTFTKLHCWRLVQFKKCVFMDSDTLVLQNCDELFSKEEISAVPDVGWPDCFNSGVFVFVPSESTYNALIQFAGEHGSFDGGDQGLLNLYFHDWSTKDITKHLSFIYNMNSNVSYTYLPAYKQFGKDVKIVHFLGPVKPWHHTFNLLTGQVQPQGSSQHMFDHLQFWWELFMTNVQPKLFPECAGLAGEMSKLTIKTAEELRHIHADQAVYGGSEARQYAWERGQIDYMGEDAFTNIQKKLDSAMTTPAEPAIAEGTHHEKKAGDKQASGTKTPPSSKSKKQSKK